MNFSTIIIIFASFLFAITNHIDKFLIIHEDDNSTNISTLLVFSSLIAGLVFSPIWLIVNKFSISIKFISLVSVISSSFIYILATFFYFKALQNNETSTIAIMLQLNPVFCYLLGVIFFKEIFNTQQIIGSTMIILSAILITIDFENKKTKNNFNLFCLMLSSCLFYGIYFILFDISIRHSSYNACAFWYQIGLLLVGIMLISIKKIRISFWKTIKTNGKIFFSLNTINEALNLAGNLLLHLTNVTLPLALSNVLNGFQSAFVFILDIIGARLLPKYFKKKTNSKIIFQKISCIILGIIGLIIMFI